MKLAITIISVILLSSCGTTPPRNPDNLCSIFKEKPDWYNAAKASSRKWGAPVHVMMSIIRQESSFQHDAKPPRSRILWVIPWTRISSSHGYSQAIDSTWQRYKDDAGGMFSSRSSFDDSMDFVGWYVNQSHKKSSIPKWNAYKQYLAYHEGQVGYNKGSYRKKPQLLKIAKKVNARAVTYERQMKGCNISSSGFSLWPF